MSYCSFNSRNELTLILVALSLRSEIPNSAICDPRRAEILFRSIAKDDNQKLDFEDFKKLVPSKNVSSITNLLADEIKSIFNEGKKNNSIIIFPPSILCTSRFSPSESSAFSIRADQIVFLLLNSVKACNNFVANPTKRRSDASSKSTTKMVRLYFAPD